MKRSTNLTRRTALAKIGARARRDAPGIKVFRETVYARANGRCERCGGSQPLHAHHIRSRAQGGTHEASNGAALCAGESGCHMRVHRGEVLDAHEWIESTKPRTP